MRKLVIFGLMAAAVMPVAAQAQSRGEIARDRHDVREERRDLDRAYRSGDPRAIHEERRELHDARRELHEDERSRRWSRDDWRVYRESNRALYARGGWHAPFRYSAFRPGVRIAPAYWDRRYVIGDPWRYHLPPARGYERWVRHYDDVLLIDARRGVVIDVYRGFFR